jgi:hypothetical protein
MPKPPGTTVSLSVPGSARSGQSFPARTTVRVPQWASTARDVRASLHLPDGWAATPSTATSARQVRPGDAVSFGWTVTAPAGALPKASPITTVVDYRQRGRAQSNRDERIVGYVPPPPPAGTDAVSDLPFLTATNGWGPVERDTSNGEQAAGDGHPITINGVKYTKGLGTNSISDVEIYLGGTCSRFTSYVGVDDEQNGAGTVTFTVSADGKTLASTPTIRGHQAATALDVDVTGAQVLDLVVGDAGDGNGNDHGDWAMPTLTCSG